MDATHESEPLPRGLGHIDTVDARVMLANVREQMFGLREPTVVGRFQLRRLLGRGAQGSVYLAEDPELRRNVAVKLLTAGLGDEAARARLLREGLALAQLNHPNVLTIHDVGVHEGRVFIAMEYVQDSLSQWCAAHPVGTRARFAALLELAIGAAQGLAAAHAAQLVHRDIKPANILVDADDRPRLGDFGLARPASGGEDVVTHGDSLHDVLSAEATLTATGQLVGTPAYMASEQFSGIGDEQSDQFSLCVTLWEAAYGERPFAGDTVAALVEARLAPLGPPPAARREVPRWWRQLLARGLAPDPSDRWPSVAALCTALLRARRRRVRPWVAGGIVSVGVAATAWAMSGQAARPCDALDAALAEVWNDVRAGEIVDRPRQKERGDAFLLRWHDEARRACVEVEGTDRATGPSPLHWDDPTLSCLRVQATEFTGLVDAMAELHGGQRGQLEALSLVFPKPEECTVEASSRDAIPVDVSVELAREMSRGYALIVQSRLDEAVATLDGVLARVGQYRSPRLEARGRLMRALALKENGRYASAFEETERALALAERSGDPAFLGKLWLDLNVLALRLGKLDEAEFYLRRAEATYAAGQKTKADEAELARGRGMTHRHQRRYGEAIVALEQAARLAMEAEGGHSIASAVSYEELASAYQMDKQTDAAIEAGRTALSASVEVHGEDSLQVVRSGFNLTNRLDLAGRTDEALLELRRALARKEAAPGVMRIEDRIMLHGYAAALFAKTGNPADARAQLSRATADAGGLDDDHPARVALLPVAGNVALDLGDYPRAIQEYEALRALPPSGVDNPATKQRAKAICVNLALAYARADRKQDARTTATECEGRLRHALSEIGEAVSRRYLAETYELVGELELARRHYATALEILERLDAHPEERAAVEEGAARLGPPASTGGG
ncbi:MAG: protein kinase [Myxococcota bacterium]